ncbi:MAG: hypothetical protein PHR25_05405 [Clostridia bacterium]|nr:hypothetical protein [Clostridia bacterium]
MKIKVNYPKEVEAIEQLENNIALFHATLLIETLKKKNLDEKSNKKILKEIITIVKEKENYGS